MSQAKRNAAFEALPANEKRVLIARDVIAQLAIGKLEAQSGTYVETDATVKKASQDLQVLLKPKDVSCTVCGIGALFVCGVQRGNDLKASSVHLFEDDNVNVGGFQAYAYLRRYFSNSQLKMIEAAFEQWAHDKGGDFAYYVEDDETRLRLIMENIILNNGTFNPAMEVAEGWYVVQKV